MISAPRGLMTGGTALTRFHGFRHRFSEDIDLFMFAPNSEKVLSWLSLLRMAAGTSMLFNSRL